jgi:hypothetical protein
MTLKEIFNLLKNPVDDYYKGMPCIHNNQLGRIVGESGKGNWDRIDNKRFYTIPIFATPHGLTSIAVITYISKISDEDLKKLNELEKDALSKGDYYANYLNDVLK